MNLGVHCYYCGIKTIRHHARKGLITPDNARTKDHKIPKSYGGKETVRCCNKCNQDKGRLSFYEFLAVIDYRNKTKLAYPHPLIVERIVEVKVPVDKIVKVAVKPSCNLRAHFKREFPCYVNNFKFALQENLKGIQAAAWTVAGLILTTLYKFRINP